MKVSIVEDHDVQGIFVRACGIFDLKQMVFMIHTVSGLDLYVDNIPILLDMRDMVFKASPADMISVARTKRIKDASRRTAIVNDTELGFGMIRILASVSDVGSLRTQAFRNIEDGLVWLYPHGRIRALPGTVANLHQQRIGGHLDGDDSLQIFQDAIGLQDRVNPA